MKSGLPVLLALSILLPACASTAGPGAADFVAFDADAATAAAPMQEEESSDGGTATLHTILMYIPNRVLDLFDIARAGVNAGPGIGGKAKATDAAQAEFMSRTSVGVGLQSLRHLPLSAGLESAAGAGPVSVEGGIGPSWYQSTSDFRLEIHPLIVGAHAAIDPVEILDFFAGFLTIDVRKDDY